ncbi:MAG: tetratricopeptide repeat protein [Myxococcaceae bacterium]|nr:tetratricopeptide repeat protein [Myxococcaceae bacterium]
MKLHGEITVTPPVVGARAAYLTRFASTRRVRRDLAALAGLPDPCRTEAGLPLGDEGGYFVGAGGELGQDGELPGLPGAPGAGVVDPNRPPLGQPSLWCALTLRPGGGTLGGVADATPELPFEWLDYLVRHFFTPWGHQLQGELRWTGAQLDDAGVITVGPGGVVERSTARPGRVLERVRCSRCQLLTPAHDSRCLGCRSPWGPQAEAAEKALDGGQRAQQARNLAAAEGQYRAALEQLPRFAFARWSLGLCLGMQGKPGAPELLAAAIDDAPTARLRTQMREKYCGVAAQEKLDLLARAQAAKDAGRPLEALAELEVVLRVAGGQSPPLRAGAWALAAAARLALGQLDEADEACRQALAADPRSARAWFHTGQVARRRGALDDARAHYRQAAGQGGPWALEAERDLFELDDPLGRSG